MIIYNKIKSVTPLAGADFVDGFLVCNVYRNCTVHSKRDRLKEQQNNNNYFYHFYECTLE